MAPGIISQLKMCSNAWQLQLSFFSETAKALRPSPLFQPPQVIERPTEQHPHLPDLHLLIQHGNDSVCPQPQHRLSLLWMKPLFQHFDTGSPMVLFHFWPRRVKPHWFAFPLPLLLCRAAVSHAGDGLSLEWGQSMSTPPPSGCIDIRGLRQELASSPPFSPRLENLPNWWEMFHLLWHEIQSHITRKSLSPLWIDVWCCGSLSNLPFTRLRP